MTDRYCIGLLALLLMANTIAATGQCVLAAGDESAVRKLPGEYRDAWFAADAESAVMPLFTADATILPHHGVKPRIGHAAIKTFWFPPSAGSFQLLKLTFDTVNVSGCGEVAYLWGQHSIEWKMKDDPKITSNAGTFLMVLRRQRDKWLIDRLMWDDPPNQVR